MKKNTLIGGAVCLAVAFIILGIIKVKEGTRLTDVQVISQLPFQIERTNPVPEVRNWNENGRTFYYFNWGIKYSGGFSLELIEVNHNQIKIRALSPGTDQLSIQMITYPSLLISLPQGHYDYVVVDETGKVSRDLFKPENEPLRFKLFLPQGNTLNTRIVFRDPYLNTEGKTTAQIGLDALFSQDEMLEYVDHEVLVEGVSFFREAQKWVVLLSPNYNRLEAAEKSLLEEIITKTLININANGLEQVEITTVPSQLPPLAD